MEPRLLVTMKDIKRHDLIQDVLAKRLKGTEAAELLGIHYIHFLRLKKKIAESGINGILRHGREAPNKKIDKFSKIVAKLYKKYYYDFNVSHFNEKLSQHHGITLSYESTRRILIREELHTPRKKKIVHRQRRRMPQMGLLLQMDSSQHHWLTGVKQKWWLIAIIDDASSEVLYARFFPSDTLYANMHGIRSTVEKMGLFTALYADKASHFKTTRRAGLHYNVNPEQDDTQIERALHELGITFIPANSPQAKGRVERLFRTFQDRLIAEMRLAGIRNYKQANKFLDTFIPDHNRRFAIKDVPSVFRALPTGINLDTVFCVKKERTVNNDNTIRLQGQVIQIPPSDKHLSFAGRKVDACILENKNILVLYRNTVICKTRLSKNNKFIKKEKNIEKILDLSQYFHVPKKKNIPPPDHPWRNFIFGKGVPLKHPKKTNILAEEKTNILT